MQSDQRNREQETGERMGHDRFDGERSDRQSRQLNDYENFARNDETDRALHISGLDQFESSTDYDNDYNIHNTNEQQVNSETTFESQSLSQSHEIQDALVQQTLAQYPALPIPGQQVPAPRQLPVPNFPLMKHMGGAEHSGVSQNDSFSSYHETRRSSRDTRESFFNDMNDTRETAAGQQALVLPSPGIRRVSVTRPVELTLPRSTFEALQHQTSEESNMHLEGRMSQQRSMPVVPYSPNGDVLGEIRLADDRSRRLLDRSNVRRSFSESNLLDMDQGAISNRAMVRFFYYAQLSQVSLAK